MTTLAVLTCPRASDYLPRTLAMLGDVSAFERRLLWSDGPRVEVDGWEIGGGGRQGPPNTFAFWDLLAAVPAGSDLLFLEDDVEASPGALAYAARMGCPEGLAFVSWFDPICRRSVFLPRVVYVNASDVVGCCARTFPAAVVQELLRFRDSPLWSPGGGSDTCVATAMAGMLAAVHTPSLFQHVGAESAVSPDAGLAGARTSESWLGPVFNVAKSFASITPGELFSAAHHR